MAALDFSQLSDAELERLAAGGEPASSTPPQPAPAQQAVGVPDFSQMSDADLERLAGGAEPAPAVAAPLRTFTPPPITLKSPGPTRGGPGSTISMPRPETVGYTGNTFAGLADDVIQSLPSPDSLVSTGLRLVPPVLVAAGTLPANVVPGPGTAANIGATALAAGIGDSLAQSYEQMRGLRSEFKPGEAIAATVAGGVPVPGGPAAVRGVLPVTRQIAGTTALLAGAGVSAETTRTLIDEGRMPTMRETLFSAAVPGGVGTGISVAGLVADRFTSLASRAAARATTFADAGVTPTPGMLAPETLARGEALRAAGSDPQSMALAAKVEEAYQQLGRGVNRMAGNTTEGAKLMEELRPLVEGLPAAEKEVLKLSRASQAATAKAAAATRKLEAAREAGVAEALRASQVEYAQASDAAFATKFDDVLANARQIAAAKIAPTGPGSMDPATARTAFVEHVAKPLREAFDGQSAALYGLVDNKAQVFDVAPVLTSAKRLASEVTGGVPSRLASALGTVREALTLSDAEGNPITRVSLDHLRNVRSEITRRVRYDQALGDNEQRLLKGVAAELTNQIDQQAATALGEEGARALRQANAFYRSTRGLLDERGVESLIQGDASDSYVRTVLEGMKKSGINSDEYRNVMKLADAISDFSPEVGTAAKAHVNDIVRQSVLFDAGTLDAVTGSMKIDTAKLADSLSHFSKVPGTLEALGLGNPRFAAQLKTLAERYPSAGSISADEWSRLWSTPAFAEAASSGRLFTELNGYLADRTVQGRMVLAANLEKAGKVGEARKQLTGALEIADKAGRDVQMARQTYEQMLADPAAVAWSNAKLSKENFNTLTLALFDPRSSRLHNQQVATLFNSLKASPKPENRALLARLRERYIADRLAAFGGAPAKGEAASRIDVQRLRNFFSPAKPGDAANELERARIVLSPDQIERMRQFAKAAERLVQYQGHSGGGAMGNAMMHSPRGSITAVSGAVNDVQGVSRGGAATVSKGVIDWALEFASRRKYNLAAWIVAEAPKVPKTVTRIDTVAGLINTVGFQRAMLMINQNPAIAVEIMGFHQPVE